MVGGAGLLSRDQKGCWGRKRVRNAVSVSVITLGLSKWSFQLITNSVNYILNIQSYQNTNKTHISFKNLLVFGGVSIALECCKLALSRRFIPKLFV